jgi:hypothetical protein
MPWHGPLIVISQSYFFNDPLKMRNIVCIFTGSHSIDYSKLKLHPNYCLQVITLLLPMNLL